MTRTHLALFFLYPRLAFSLDGSFPRSGIYPLAGCTKCCGSANPNNPSAPGWEGMEELKGMEVSPALWWRQPQRHTSAAGPPIDGKKSTMLPLETSPGTAAACKRTP